MYRRQPRTRSFQSLLVWRDSANMPIPDGETYPGTESCPTEVPMLAYRAYRRQFLSYAIRRSRWTQGNKRKEAQPRSEAAGERICERPPEKVESKYKIVPPPPETMCAVTAEKSVNQSSRSVSRSIGLTWRPWPPS